MAANSHSKPYSILPAVFETDNPEVALLETLSIQRQGFRVEVSLLMRQIGFPSVEHPDPPLVLGRRVYRLVVSKKGGN